MTYITAIEAAKRWDVTARAVQKWAKEAKIPGARKLGRSWLIPDDAKRPAGGAALAEKRLMPLMAGAFVSGMSQAYIDGLEDEEERQMALAERFYFRGEPQQASDAAQVLLNSQSLGIRISALLVHSMANIALGRLDVTREDFVTIHQERLRHQENTPLSVACGFAEELTLILLHNPKPDMADFSMIIPHLPEGVQLYFFYVQAHYYYLTGNYQKSLGIAQTALTFGAEKYPISSIYLHLVCAMDHISLLEKAAAREAFQKAWAIAAPESFLEPFGEHHGLLYGLLEACLKDSEPELFQKVIRITYQFSSGWRGIHNPATNERVAGELTTLEFSIAMLASKGWTNKEIAEHLAMSPNSIKLYISTIYQKLGINSRKQLAAHLLK